MKEVARRQSNEISKNEYNLTIKFVYLGVSINISKMLLSLINQIIKNTVPVNDGVG